MLAIPRLGRLPGHDPAPATIRGHVHEDVIQHTDEVDDGVRRLSPERGEGRLDSSRFNLQQSKGRVGVEFGQQSRVVRQNEVVRRVGGGGARDGRGHIGR